MSVVSTRQSLLHLTYREVYALVLEDLSQHSHGQYGSLGERIFDEAFKRALIPSKDSGNTVETSVPHLTHYERNQLWEWVRQALWECLVKGLLIFGYDKLNANWPFYRLTDSGKEVLTGTGTVIRPQPYDPDRFIASFHAELPTTDPTVSVYFEEAVLAFNAGCQRSAAVMLGGASEKLILILCEALAQSALLNVQEQNGFEKALASAFSITKKYSLLKGRLDALKFPAEHANTRDNLLPAGFEMLRRFRNDAGHPELPNTATPDLNFVNLRLFIEYARQTSALIDYVKLPPTP